MNSEIRPRLKYLGVASDIDDSRATGRAVEIRCGQLAGLKGILRGPRETGHRVLLELDSRHGKVLVEIDQDAVRLLEGNE